MVPDEIFETWQALSEELKDGKPSHREVQLCALLGLMFKPEGADDEEVRKLEEVARGRFKVVAA